MGISLRERKILFIYPGMSYLRRKKRVIGKSVFSDEISSEKTQSVFSDT